MKNNYEVIVGNIGSIHQGCNRRIAERKYRAYVQDSIDGHGRAAGESVALFNNGEPIKEHNPPELEISDPKLQRRQKLLDGAKEKLQRAKILLENAGKEMREAGNHYFPKGACGSTVDESAAFVEQILTHFPTAIV